MLDRREPIWWSHQGNWNHQSKGSAGMWSTGMEQPYQGGCGDGFSKHGPAAEMGSLSKLRGTSEQVKSSCTIVCSQAPKLAINQLSLHASRQGAAETGFWAMGNCAVELPSWGDPGWLLGATLQRAKLSSGLSSFFVLWHCFCDDVVVTVVYDVVNFPSK